MILHNRVLRKKEKKKMARATLVSNFRRVLNLVCILLGISPASDSCMPTFRNTLPVPSS